MFKDIDLLQFKQPVAPSTFILFGQIDLDVAASCAEWIINNNAVEEPADVLNLIINSPGGDLAAAWAIIDLINGSSIPVRTIGLGQIASAGLLIFMSGTNGLRTLSENCSVMSHQYYWGIEGKHHELLAVQKEYTLMQNRLVSHFTRSCGLAKKDIDKYLMPPHDVYLSAEEAMRLGLCDVVKTLK